MPDGARIQVVAPPATRGSWALAICKHVAQDLSLADYVSAGAFEKTHVGDALRTTGFDRVELDGLAGILASAVHMRRNILVSGGTSTGKTTFLNALTREIPPEERLIFIEDTTELHIIHKNAVGLLATRSALREADISADDLVLASLRMRPDRIIPGELCGAEAYAFLRAINSGHPGSMTTIHANSAEGAIEQLVLLALQGGTRLSRDDVRHYVRTTIGVFIQLARTAGRRHVAEMVVT